MPIEFQVPSLRFQIHERLGETESKQHRLATLLKLEGWIHNSMWLMEQEQRRRKAFVDGHRTTACVATAENLWDAKSQGRLIIS